ncbi:MAG TPA: hypothetical protein VIF62_37725 [Labilithrix sp.]
MSTLRARVQLSLAAVHIVAFATLLRSVLYERWITVLASVLLMLGAFAAQRGKTWGIGIALGAAVAFPAAFAIGIAPAWFCLVGLVGALPFFLTSRVIARFDAAAAAIGASVAAAFGVIGAVGYRAIAPWIFTEFPSLRPSWEPEHVGLAAVLAIATIAAAVIRPTRRLRVAEPSVRVAAFTESAEEEEANEEAEEPERARLRR